MTATGAEREIAHAIVDAEGRLDSADLAIERLNTHAGGSIGKPLAVPQLATVARLARRLGVIVSRGIVVADEDADLDLWVRAQPDGDRVRLAISGWREMRAWRPARISNPASIAQAGADLCWETDRALCLTFVSLDAAAAAGVDAFALLGQPLTALFTLEGGEDGTLPILAAVAAQRPVVDQAARVRATGAPVILSATVRQAGGGVFAGLSGTAVMSSQSAPPVPEALSRTFTEGLDAALRSSLARIVANADSITARTDGPIAPGYADYAADIAGAGRHLLSLVDDLVDLQAVEQQDFTLPSEPIDLADVARRAAALLAIRASDAQVSVERPAANATLIAGGNFRRALQIAANLLGNALRYAPAVSTIGITVGQEGDRAWLTVADQGKGIAAADQQRIFDKFERVDPEEPGTNGLGLYIARRLARAMGGDLTVASSAGEGARFTLSLTAQPSSDQQ